MQNEFGLIKIGRSIDVERRRLTLQSTERCRIQTVEIYTGCGDMEEDIHLDMDDHRLAGEWFDGSDESRATLCELISCDNPPIGWPYAYDPSGASAWLDHINVVRHAAAIRRELYRRSRFCAMHTSRAGFTTAACSTRNGEPRPAGPQGWIP